MRLLQGTKVVEAPAGWRAEIDRDGRPVVVDVGAGDGRFVYEAARSHPEKLYVGLEPDAATLSEYAFRAARKPARGGVHNAAFVVGSVEYLPRELKGLAKAVAVNYPWGSLLRGLLQPEPDMLRAVASLARPGASFRFVLTYEPGHDTAAFAGGPLPPLSQAHVDAVLVPEYAHAGLRASEGRRLSQEEALAVPSTWGRRLLHARPRDVYLLAGQVFTTT